MQITLIIPSLFCGGVERIVTAMANYWTSQGKKITLLTFDDGATPPFYNLDRSVVHQPLALAKDSGNFIAGGLNNIKRLMRLRRAIKKSEPDVVISFIVRANIRTLMATRGLGIPVIISERADPQRQDLGRVWRRLRQVIYPLATKIVTHTQYAAAYLKFVLRREIDVIPNPLTDFPTPGKKSFSAATTILSAGRLEVEKGYDLLLQAFAKIAHHYPDVTLKILGEGRERKNLEQLRANLDLSERILLPGAISEINGAFREADIFVSSSRFEGFGNALCEAMAHGVPVIATDCIGPQEIIQDGVDGVLVPIENVEALAAALQRLLSAPDERRQLATNSVSVRERYSLEKIMTQWDELIEECRN